MTTRKFHKTLITIEVLSEEPYTVSDLESLAWDINSGAQSGMIVKEEQVIVDGKEMADALLSQGSDPSFFQLTDEGEDLD